MDNLVGRIKFGENFYDPEGVSELAVASFGYIERDMQNIREGYISLGFHLNEMQILHCHEELGYSDFYECVQRNFGMDKSAVSRCISVWKEFAAYDDNASSRKMWIDDRYAGYSYSQLTEMLSLKKEERGRITPDMSVREIREFKKTLKKKKSEKPIENAVEQEAVATSQPERKELDAVKEDEMLSAYGTRLKVRDENSLCFMPGCKNDDCFSCHLNCEIRQADCHCVEAPCGNPFPCTTLAAYENIKQDIGDACQFVNLELAYHRAGDGAAVPCCKKCDKPCGYQCDRASKWRYEKEELERQKQKEREKEEELVTQPEFPDMKNKQEREDFVDAYKTWDVWCRNDMTEEVFYRYDLPDDAAIVVKNYPYYLDWKNEECEGRKLYLLKPGYKHFANCVSTMTEIEKYLRDLRKKGYGWRN